MAAATIIRITRIKARSGEVCSTSPAKLREIQGIWSTVRFSSATPTNTSVPTSFPRGMDAFETGDEICVAKRPAIIAGNVLFLAKAWEMHFASLYFPIQTNCHNRLDRGDRFLPPAVHVPCGAKRTVGSP